MKRRYELTISTDYVANWTYIEAFRELFQNAIDNEIQNPSNKMIFEHDKENNEVRICNKTSVLEIDSLLLGSTTKADDENTIGKHGEGYKVAFVVLLREGKTIAVYNYGKREIWTVRLIASKRFNGKQIPVVTVEREAIWKSVPDNDLTIVVGNVTEEEFEGMRKKNLNLRPDSYRAYEKKGVGRVLLNPEEQGNVYVKGLYISNIKNLRYGYDFEPSRIDLDRDRSLVKTFDVAWEASNIWAGVTSYKGDDSSELVEMAVNAVLDNAVDVQYIHHMIETEGLNKKVTDKFLEEHGEKAIPVTTTDEYETAKSSGYVPIIAARVVTDAYIRSGVVEDYDKIVSKEDLKAELKTFIDKVEEKLTDEELKEITSIWERMKS